MLWRRSVGVFALVLLAAYAYAPLFGIGLVREDYSVLASAAAVAQGRGLGPDRGPVGRAFEVEGTGGHPLAGLSLVLSHRLWSDDGSWVSARAQPLRVENLALVLLMAVGLAFFVRRSLQPWTGSEQAGAAAWAVLFLTVLHPFHLASVTSLAARGNLLAAAFGAWAAAAFLRGRQERRYNLIAVACGLAMLAALSSGIGLALPLVVAGVELASAHRYRPLHTRLRTAANTLLVFTGFVLIDTALRSVHARAFRAPSFLGSLADVDGPTGGLRAVVVAVEKLGLAFLPVDPFSIGILGYALAGALVLAALQPGLVAARSAPRLWGWLLLAWTVLLVLAFVPDFTVRVDPRDLSQARVLFPLSIVMAAGLGTTATALPGLRRLLVPIGVATGFAILSHANGLPWVEASEKVERLRSDLAHAVAVEGRDARYLVIDPPGREGRVDALGDALPWLVRDPFAVAPAGAELPIRGIALDAFRVFVRERELAEERRAGLVVVYPRVALPELNRRKGHLAVRLGPPADDPDVRPWYREGRSPDLDVDPLELRALFVDVEIALANAPPRLGWRSRWDVVSEGRTTGTWLFHDAAPIAVFELDALSWLLGQRIRRVWSVEGWNTMLEARFVRALPQVAADLVPRVDEDDWLFEGVDTNAVAVAGERGVWVLVLLDLSSLALTELPVAIERGALVAAGAAAEVAAIVRRAGGPVAWALWYQVDGVTIAETRGRRRRVGRRDSVEEDP